MNEKGFTLILFLIITPVLVSILIGLGQMGQFLKNKSSGLNICRSGLLEIQKMYVKNIISLEKLNPRASLLRLKEKKIRAQIAAAQISNPTVVPALIILLNENLAQQVALKTQQEYLIQTAEYLARKKINNLLREIYSSKISGSITKLAFEGVPPSAIAKTYKPLENFESNQAIKLKWEIEKFKIKSECSATITKSEDNTWTPKLGTAKFL